MKSAVIAVTALLAAGLMNALGPAPLVGPAPSVPFVPDDPGWTGRAQGWQSIQWNLAGPFGVDAPAAWGHLRAAGADGGAGVTVAVLDTGVASPPGDAAHPASPDLDPDRIVAGYDFVNDDRFPYDQNGHGTHVASTIAETADNGVGLTGLAYGVDLMPVRVLDRTGAGDPVTIARGLRYAVGHGAQVINLSLNFAGGVSRSGLSDLSQAFEEAHGHGVLVVVGTGNTALPGLDYPASAARVLAVGATTEFGCLSRFSNYGPGIDLVAPGGGGDANIGDDPHCRPGRVGSPVYQVTRAPAPRIGVFEEAGFIGTSMAAPHVSATAALVIASRVIGERPTPEALAVRLESTARDLGPTGYDSVYGWGLVNAGAATDPEFAR